MKSITKSSATPPRVRIYDTTLRDGNQGMEINLLTDDKLKIARKLSEFGAYYVEGGWPNATNPAELEFFRRAKSEGLKSKITAFGMTRKASIKPEQDDNLSLLLKTEADYLTIFGKSWNLHVEKVLETTPENNLTLISDSVSFLKDHGYKVIYDAEHFYDGFKQNPYFALETIKAANRAGASEIVLCDTRGASMSGEIYEITSFVKAEVGKPVGVHAHNDRGLAIANSLAAVEAGADHVQCTINGVGERCGNADLIQVVGNLELSLKVNTGVDLSRLTELSDYFYELATVLNKNSYQPFTGTYAFAHKGGIHIHAVLKCPEAYEHVDPSLLGNKRIIPISSQVGLAGVVTKGKEFGFTLNKNDPKAKAVLRKIKEMEAQGYNFENAQASLFFAYARILGMNLEFFRLLNWRATVERINSQVTADCTVKVKINEDVDIMTTEGNGPVNAFDLALRKALEIYYPELKKLKLVGYRVREINVEKGTAATVRVFIEFEASNERFSAVGVSTNILKASEEALVDGYMYYLHKIGRRPPVIPRHLL